MKKFWIACGISAAIIGISACSATSTDEPSKSLNLGLTAEGENLRLSGVPGRPDYRPSYPNPNGIAKMDVRIKKTGAIVSSCTDGKGSQVDCGDTPFFTRVIRIAIGVRVEVIDVYGEACGSQEFPDDKGGGGSGGESTGCDTNTAGGRDSGTTCGGNDDNRGDQGGGDVDKDKKKGDDTGKNDGDGKDKKKDKEKKHHKDDKDNDEDDDEKDCSCKSGGSGSGGGANATCDEAGAKANRDAFCSSVNKYLAERHLPAIDCSVLDSDGYDKKPVPPAGAKGACGEIWKPHYRAVSSWLSGCKSMKERATHWHEVVRWQLIHEGACSHSPIVLDLDGNGIQLTTPERGVSFDLLGKGAVRAAWTEGADGLLALDRNGNSEIDGASELFGNSTAGRDFDDGFAALSELDANNDGVIDSRDPAYTELVVWQDVNHDGKSEKGELATLHDAHIRRLYLSAAKVGGPASFDPNGNRIPLVSAFERTDGTKSIMADVFLRYRPL